MRGAELGWAVGFGAWCIMAPVQAADVAGIKLADKVTVASHELVLNGAGVRTKVLFKVYVASLYLPTKASEPTAVLGKAPRRIQLNLLRSVTADQLADSLNEGLQDNNTEAELSAVKRETAELIGIMKSFGEAKEGSVITLDFIDGSTVVGFNGANAGTVAGEPFNRALTKIWLGDKPVQGDLKTAMLGG